MEFISPLFHTWKMLKTYGYSVVDISVMHKTFNLFPFHDTVNDLSKLSIESLESLKNNLVKALKVWILFPKRQSENPVVIDVPVQTPIRWKK